MMPEAGTPRWASDEVVRAALAYAAVPGAVAALALVWLLAPLTDGEALARADGLSRWLQAAMTAVIGFYFGQLGTRRAEQRAKAAEGAAARAASSVTPFEELAEATERRVAAFERALERARVDPSLSAKLDELLRESEGEDG